MNESASSANLDQQSGIKIWLKWGFVALITAPVTIILHECGHLLFAIVFEFPKVMFHYSSVSHEATIDNFQTWQLGIQAIAGPVVTLFLVSTFTVLSDRFGSSPLKTAPAFAAGFRAALLGSAYLLVRILHPSRAHEGNFDELNAANYLGISPDLVMGVSVLIILGTWIYLGKLIPKIIRWKALLATFVGTVVGIVIWFSVVGPLFLP